MPKMTIFSGTGHKSLAALIAERLGQPLSPIHASKFANGETDVKVGCSVREEEVFIIQSCVGNVNDNLMELLIMINACKTASAKRIHCIIPYLPYGKSTKMKGKRTAMCAKICAQMIKVAGADHCVTMDLHSPEVQGFFSLPCDNMYAAPLVAKYIRENWVPAETKPRDSIVIVGKNSGAAKRVAHVAEILRTNFSVIHKEQFEASADDDESEADETAGETEESAAEEKSAYKKHRSLTLVGDVQGKTAIIVDDMIDKCASFIDVAKLLKSCGAKRVHVVVTHGLFGQINSDTPEARHHIDALNSSEIEKIVVTNTTPQEDNLRLLSKLEVVDISPLMAETIRRIRNKESISWLFKNVPFF